MRLNRIDLTRFGVFTDRIIDLPNRAPDFHVIVGSNEAGKSTLRSAISELLFGIDVRSPFNFVHDYNSMCLGALVSDADLELEFSRLKRNKQSLRDSSDEPLPDSVLAPFLGATDRAFFERMFALDHRQLEKGGLEILHAKDDVALMLFEASAGLGSFGDFRDRLEAEAKGLWDRRKSKDRNYYQALERYDSARADLKKATIRVSAWKKANQRVDAETAALDEASKALTRLETERSRLERIRRVAAHLQTRRSRLQERAELGAVVSLPSTAADQLESARADIVDAESRIRKHETLIEEFSEKRDAISVDETLLGQREAITDIEAQRHEVRKFPSDIAKRKTEVETLLRSTEQTARDLGWEMADEDTLSARIPSQLVRTEISGLLQEHGRLEQAVSSTANAVAEKSKELAAQQQEIERKVEVRLPTTLVSRLARARALGDADARRVELRGNVLECRQSVNRVIAQLFPWNGDVDALRNLRLPSEEFVHKTQARLSELSTRSAVIEKDRLETEREIELRKLEELQEVRGNNPVTSESLIASREERDGLWRQIRTGSESTVSAGDAFEVKVEAADQIADRRYQEAEQAERLESIRSQLERLALRRSNQVEDAHTLAEEIKRVESDWRSKMDSIRLDDMQMSEFSTWRNNRAKVFVAADALASAETQLAEFESLEKAEIEALSAVLGEAGCTTPEAGDRTLAVLLETAEHRISETETANVRKEELERVHTQSASALEALESEATRAATLMAEWTERWKERAEEIGLHLDTAHTALQLFDSLANALKDIRNLRRDRIQTMQRDLDTFRKITAEITARVAPDLTKESPERAAALLSELLRHEETSQIALKEANEGLKKNAALRDDAREHLRVAREKVRPFLDLAGVDDIQELADAIRLSDMRREVDSAIDAATESALQNGDGLDVDALEAEVAAEDVAALAARLEELGHERDEATTRRDECLLEKNQAEAARAEMAGQADAASAAARSEEALADMASAVERYLKVFTGARLLRWAIDRYREEKQGPLLRRAGEIFSTLTLGSFEKLTVIFDGGTPQLLGRRPDGKHTDVDGMSDATRDQLFMALRLAAVELHLDHAQALPFIADDLFINYDDERSRAGFKVLKELAGRTQVIFLTHHEHLVPVAQGVLGTDLNIISLER